MSAKLCCVEQRAPPIFGRAAITLGIGPHSIVVVVFGLHTRWTDRPTTENIRSAFSSSRIEKFLASSSSASSPLCIHHIRVMSMSIRDVHRPKNAGRPNSIRGVKMTSHGVGITGLLLCAVGAGQVL